MTLPTMQVVVAFNNGPLDDPGLFVGGSGYAAAVRADSPTAWWRLSDPYGPVAADWSGSTPGTYVGGVTFGQTSFPGTPYESCVSFDGSTGYVSTALAAFGNATTPSTVEAWAFIPAGTANSYIFTSETATSGAGLYYSGLTGVIIFRGYNSTTGLFVQITAPVSTGWHHIVGTRSIVPGQTLNIYIDGSLAATSAGFNFAPGTQPWTIGRDSSGGSHWTGRLAHTAIYNTVALTSAQVAAHHTAGAAYSPVALGVAGEWTDITQWVQSCDITRGRQHELAQSEAATVSLPLNNEDGRFNPWNTSGPYTGLLVPRKTVQVRATSNGVTYTRFTGQVNAWETDWPDTVVQKAAARGDDVFRMLAGGRFGAINAASADAVLGKSSAAIPNSSPFSVQFTVNTTGIVNGILWSISGLALLTINSSGQIVAGTGGFTLTSTISVNDGNPHWIGLTYNPYTQTGHILIDGILNQSGSMPTSWTSAVPVLNASFGGTFTGDYSYFLTALSDTQITDIYWLLNFPQETTSTRINRVLDLIGWPTAARNIDAGVSTVQANTSDLTQTSALQHMQDVGATEGGALFIDTAGRFRFVNRHAVFNNTVMVTSQATFGDKAGDIPFVPAPVLATSDVDIYTEGVGQRTGGTLQTFSNETAVQKYGRQTWRPSGQLLGIDDSEVLGQLQYVVGNASAAKSRLASISVTLLNMSTAQQATVLALDLLYQITVERQSVPGSLFTQAGLIEHIAEHIDPQTWTINFGLDVDDVATNGYWVIGTSQLGVNTTLIY